MQKKTSRKGLILNCTGGLGNQMFEYAAGRYFARQTGRSLEIVKPIADHQKWGTFNRPFQLSEFCIPEPVREESWLDRLLFSRNPKILHMRRVASSFLNVQVLDEVRPFHFDHSLPFALVKESVYLNGYWQAVGYAQGVESELREAFTLRNPLLDRNKRYAEKIRNLRCPVSVHCRLGDYELISHSTGNGKEMVSNVLPFSYYEDAISAAHRHMDSVTFVVFSDDPLKARALFADLGECLFIEGNDFRYAQEDMWLMSQCKHHIIANSSFSWWGAWLNQGSEKTVYVPKFWANTSNTHFQDLCPPTWMTINNV